MAEIKVKWADSKDISTIYGISKRRLKVLRQQKLIEHRKEGQKYLHLVDSVEAYISGTSVKPDLKKIYVDRVMPILKKEVAKQEGANNQITKKIQGGAVMPTWKKSQSKKEDCWYVNLGDLTLEEHQGVRGIHYCVDFRQGEKRRTKSLSKLCGQEVNSREEAFAAMALVRVKLYEEAKESHRPNGDQLTISQYIPIYLREKKNDQLRGRSFRKIMNAMQNQIEPYFGEMLMKDVRREHIKAYRDSRRRKGVKDASIWNNELAYLKEMFNLALEHDIVHFNPVRKSKLKLKIEQRKRYMMPSEKELLWPLLKKYPPLDQLADLIYDNAMRPANICDLQWPWIYRAEGFIIVPKEFHKQKTVGKYTLSSEIIAMLEERKRMAEKFDDDFPYVFWREENGKRYKIHPRWIQYKWAAACAEAGIEGLNFYDLKRTCLSELGSMGFNDSQLQSVSNHLSIISLAVYVNPEMYRQNGTSQAMLNLRNEMRKKGSINGNGKASTGLRVENASEYLF